jgi:hypothetical protein
MGKNRSLFARASRTDKADVLAGRARRIAGEAQIGRRGSASPIRERIQPQSKTLMRCGRLARNAVNLTCELIALVYPQSALHRIAEGRAAHPRETGGEDLLLQPGLHRFDSIRGTVGKKP